MPDQSPTNNLRPGWFRLVLPWVVWGVLLVVWTCGLVFPVPETVSETVPSSMHFEASKGLHLIAYAFMAVVVWWLLARWWVRVSVWALLIAHAAMTEYIQTFVPGRWGTWSDVGLDSAGVLLGIGAGLLVRRWLS